MKSLNLTIVISLISTFVTIAQEHGVVFGQNLTFLTRDDSNEFTSSKESTLRISPSLTYIKLTEKQNFHEFGLANFSYFIVDRKTTIDDITINEDKSDVLDIHIHKNWN